MNAIPIEYPDDLTDYTLIDSGNGEKLEKFSGYTIVRPDPRILWKPSQDASLWEKADARYDRLLHEGSWNIKRNPPHPWIFRYRDLSFILKPTDFKHVGIFPEQTVNWDWMKTVIGGHKPSILNLFAYTGGATCVAAQCGAHVTHVDSVKSTIAWANENVKRNTIPYDQVRWIEDDAYKFVLREQKRGKTYDAVIMDPPRFGRGAKGEVWKLEDDLPKLLTAVNHILSPNPLFVLINCYTADISSLVLRHLMDATMNNKKGIVTSGELATQELFAKRFLPQGIFCRWNSISP